MAANQCGAFAFADSAVWAELNYNPVNLQVQSITFANATADACAVEIRSPAGIQNAYSLPAATPQTQMNVGNQHVQLVARSTDRTGGAAQVVGFPDDWTLLARWPAT